MVLNLKLVISYIISIVPNILWAQSFEWTFNNFKGSVITDIIVKDNKNYAVVSNGVITYPDSSINYQLSIFEISCNNSGPECLSLNEVITIPFPEYATYSVDYISKTRRWLIVQSKDLTNEKQSFRVILLNENFEQICQSSIDTSGYPIKCFISTYKNKTNILGSILGPPRSELFYLQYDHDFPDSLPPIKITQSEPHEMFWVTSMEIDSLKKDMLVFYYNGVAELDSNLHQNLGLNYGDIHTSDHGTIILNNKNYFSHGATSQGLGNGKRWLVLQKYDTLFHVLKADTFGIDGRDNYPFVFKSIDTKNNELLIGGHLDGPLNHVDVFSYIKRFYLSKYDLSLHQIWYKEFGGDRAYWFSGVKLMDDGDGLAYGFITDSTDHYRYAYIMHVDANGEILTSTTIPFSPKTTIQIVNPGDEALRILNPDQIDAQIELYDIQGCRVLTGIINSEISEINAQDLPTGLYAYVLIRDGHSIGSGKWIKAK